MNLSKKLWFSSKCTGSCNLLSPKIYVLKKTKDIHFKEFNMITNKNEAKAMTEYLSYDCKWKFNSTISNSSQNWNNKTCQYECKNSCKCKKDYIWNPSSCICENSKYLKIITYTWVIGCDEIIIFLNNFSTKTTIATNITSTSTINCIGIKVKDC